MGKKKRTSAKSRASAGSLRDRILSLLQAAHDQKPQVKWLTQLLTRVGFTRVTTGKGGAVALVSAHGLAAGLKVSERTVSGYIADGLPIYEVGSGNRGSTFDLFAVMRWLKARDGEEDPLMNQDPTSLAMEAYRSERYREVKLRNDLAERIVLPLDQVRSTIQEISGALRAELEAVERLHGREVGDAIRGMIDRAESSLRSRVLGEKPKEPAVG